MIDLKENYNKKIVPEMLKELGYKNKMAVPKIEKVVINIGFGKEINGKSSNDQKKMIEDLSNDISMIVGQRPAVTRAKQSISGFKLREGNPIGLRVTLRGKRMYNFLSKLINVALPRSRDFSGIDRKSFDREGNLNIGIKEHIIFPEVSAEKMKNIFGFEITVKTTAKTKDEGIKLLEKIGLPLKKK